MPDPWMFGETSGIVKAGELRPEIAGRMMSRFRTLFVVGDKIGEYPIEVVKQMIEKSEAKVIKTQSIGSDELEVDKFERYGLMEIADMLCEPPEGWDFGLVVVAGIAYHIESRFIADLKACGADVRIITLNWRHQQRADFSFPNITDPEEWGNSLKEIIAKIK